MHINRNYGTPQLAMLMVIALLLQMLWTNVAVAAAWEIVGTAAFSDGEVEYVKMASYQNKLYVIYEDATVSKKATVMMNDGSGWTVLGNKGFSDGEVWSTSICADAANGDVYVFYFDKAVNKAVVKKFNGTNWINVGTAGPTAGGADMTAMAVYNQVPYIAYRDTSGTGGYKAKVSLFNGTTWDVVGAGAISEGVARGVALDFDNNGVPYVFYSADSTGGNGKPVVKKMNGTNWTLVGNANFSDGDVTDISLCMDGTTPYVAFTDVANQNKATVMKYDGTAWGNVGNKAFTANRANNNSLVIVDGTPYVAFTDNANSQKATVMKNEGSNWGFVGSQGFTSTVANNISMIKKGDALYLAYKEYAATNKATVQKYALNAAEVILVSGSLGTPGNGEITGLDANKRYKVIINGTTTKYVAAAGTLSDTEAGVGALIGTKITGLTNGTNYKVEEYVASGSPDYTVTKDGSSFKVGANTYTTLAGALGVCTNAGADNKLIIKLGDGTNPLEMNSCSLSNADNNLSSATFIGKVNITIGDNSKPCGFNIPSGVTATLQDLTVTNNSTSYGFRDVNIVQGGTLNIEEGTVITSSFTVASTNNLLVNRGTLNINGGMINGDVNAGTGIYNTGTLNITGGTIKILAASMGTAVSNYGNTTVSGTALLSAGQYGVANEGTAGQSLTVNGGTIEATGVGGQAIMTRAASVNVTGGMVKSTSNNSYAICSANGTGGIINISGGTVSGAGNTAIYVQGDSLSPVTISGGTIKSVGDKTLLLGKNATTADNAKFIVHGLEVYRHNDADISIAGVVDVGDGNLHVLSSANKDNASVSAASFVAGKSFSAWTSDPGRNTSISTVNGAAISSLSAGGVTKTYLKSDIVVSAPTVLPTGGSFADTDNDASQIGGTISWTAANPTTGITGYKIYWGSNATTKLAVNNAVVYTVAGAASHSQTVTADTTLPAGATHFLIYSYNSGGNSGNCRAIAITDVNIKVALAQGSAGTAGSGKITGLTAGSRYKVTVGGATKYVKADGILSDNEADVAVLTGTEITGLTNGTTYMVAVYSTTVLAKGSLGTVGDQKIAGLTAGSKYKVTVGGATKYVKADGTLSDNEADVDGLTGTAITGLTNGTTYKAELYIATNTVLASGSLGTVGDQKITGLTAGSKYKVTVDGATKYVKADGTLSDNEADVAALTGTEITGLTNGSIYKIETYSGVKPAGTGTQADPYLIANADNLEWMSSSISSQNKFSDVYFKQTANIDMSAVATFNPIGNQNNRFGGKYNGGNYKISNLKITDDNTLPDTNADDYNGCHGLFGSLGNAEVENVVLEDLAIDIKMGNASNYSAYVYAGGLAGTSLDSRITNCRILQTSAGSSQIKVTSEGQVSFRIGGMVGYARTTNLVRVENQADLIGNVKEAEYSLGGIAAEVEGGRIENALNSGNVRVAGNLGNDGKVHSGGIAATGMMTTVKNTLNTGNMDASGLNGDNSNSKAAGIIVISCANTLTSNYSLNTAAGVGCVLARNEQGEAVDLTDANVALKTAAELKSQATYMGWTTDVWKFIPDSYPGFISAGGFMTDVEAVAGAKIALDETQFTYASGDSQTGVTGSLTLPLTGANGTTITWTENPESSAVSINVQTGVVTVSRPANGSGNAVVTLRAVISKGSPEVTDSKDLTITVKAQTAMTDAQAVAEAKAALDETRFTYASGDSQTSVIGNFTLPLTGANGTTITWTENPESSAVSINVQTGVVTVSRPANGSGNAVVTLRAAITRNGSSDTKDLTLKVKQQASSGSAGGNGGGNNNSVSPQQSNTGANILVNGKTENAGTANMTQVGNQTVTTVVLDQQKMEQKLNQEGNHSIVTIPVNTNADVVVGELNGQMVKNMESKQAVVEVKTEAATYTLPAQQINIDEVSAQIGTDVNLQNIKVQIRISKPDAQETKIIENSAKAGEFTIVAPSVEFNVQCTFEGKTVSVSSFNAYVERTIAIPAGVDPNKITTGVVVDPDGTARHVPTKVVQIDGKYYAKINSLTNSTYSVVWHPREFKDVDKHWAKAAVNDMGSRMVIRGVNQDNFEPEREISRAEFAVIIVKALGLKPGVGSGKFTDVNASDWYNADIKTALQYQIISGYGNGKFGPNDRITREQAMAMISRAMNITKLAVEFKDGEANKLLSGFVDGNQTTAYAARSIAACVKSGIVNGKSGQRVAPKDDITRAEVAVIVQKLLQKSGLI